LSGSIASHTVGRQRNLLITSTATSRYSSLETGAAWSCGERGAGVDFRLELLPGDIFAIERGKHVSQGGGERRGHLLRAAAGVRDGGEGLSESVFQGGHQIGKAAVGELLLGGMGGEGVPRKPGAGFHPSEPKSGSPGTPGLLGLEGARLPPVLPGFLHADPVPALAGVRQPP